jgi:arginase family enzyme
VLTEPRYTGWLPADVGLRDIDRGERVMLQQLGITAFTMREIDKHGIAKVMELSLAQLVNSSDSSLHVSFDIDALCPTWSGLTSQALLRVFTVSETKRFIKTVSRQ